VAVVRELTVTQHKSFAAQLAQTERYIMKKFIVVLLMFMVLGFALPSAEAQRRHRRHRQRTFWQKHRDKLTVAGTSAAGAGVGALGAGKKGAVIGAGAGAGAGALYTYKLRKRHRRRY
jgi:hypothetical protein